MYTKRLMALFFHGKFILPAIVIFTSSSDEKSTDYFEPESYSNGEVYIERKDCIIIKNVWTMEKIAIPIVGKNSILWKS